MIEHILRVSESTCGVSSPEFILYPGRATDLTTLLIRSTSSNKQIIAKYGKTQQHNNQIRMYSNLLREINDRFADSKLEKTFPDVLYFSTTQENNFVLESTISGKPCDYSTKKSHIDQVLRVSRQWLTSIYSPNKDLKIDECFRSLLKTSGVDFNSRPPVGFTHCDFTMSNIFLKDGQLSGVIDWDESVLSGLPVVDLLTLIVDISFQQAQSINERIFERVFYEENWYSRLVESHINNYCEDMGISKSQVRKHIPIWLHHSIESTERHMISDWHDHLIEIEKDYTPERIIW